jgi:hypothetical protein
MVMGIRLAGLWGRGRTLLPSLYLRSLGRGALLLVVAAVLVAPIALGWTIANTHVEEQVGITPTTLRLTTTGHSELRLGIAGTVFIPRHRGPFGVIATVNGPAAGREPGTDLASYVSPRMLELYSGLFHDPRTSVQGYISLLVASFLHQLWRTEFFLTLVAAAVLFLVRRAHEPPGRLLPEGRTRSVVLLLGVLLASSAIGLAQVRAAEESARPGPGRYDLPALDGTVAAGSTTNSPILRLVLGDAVPKVHTLIDRQEKAVSTYLTQAEADLRQQRPEMAAPRDGEVAVLMQSDMHCNTTMIRLQHKVREMLQESFGDAVPAAVAVTGDLTTNGTPAEGGCVRDERAIAGDLPMVAVTGNHESDVSADQMRDVGMKVLDHSRAEVDGVSVLGANDPSRTELFGGTSLRDHETEQDVGRQLYQLARSERSDLLLVHEAYAAESFIGTDDMRAFLDNRGSATTAYDDGVRDLPVSAVLYGHWHRSVAPRVVWNSDGSWTLVMELNTSGGAIATPTIGHFSTPWTKPQQEASFPVLYLDRASGLVTGYQIYRFETDGTTTVEPRVDIGAPDFLEQGRSPRSS